MNVVEELEMVCEDIERAEACLEMGEGEAAKVREEEALVRLGRVVDELEFGDQLPRLAAAWRRLGR